MKIKIEKMSGTAMLPGHGSEYAAGYDLYPDEGRDVCIVPGATVKIGTGIKMEIPNGYFGAIFARSGLATKQGLRPANCVGVIDSDYRGEIIVALHNDSTVPRVVKSTERIAQIVFLPCQCVEFEEVDDLSDTVRADGGFGSTGTQQIRGQMSLFSAE